MKRFPRLRLIGLAVVALSGPISPASAQTFSSSYTSSAPKDCRTIGKPGHLEGGTTRVRPEFARDFKCGMDEVKVIGERGRAVELARR